MCSARVRCGLLDTARLVRQGSDERNFHVFYQLCAGADGAQRTELGLEAENGIFIYQFSILSVLIRAHC